PTSRNARCVSLARTLTRSVASAECVPGWDCGSASVPPTCGSGGGISLPVADDEVASICGGTGFDSRDSDSEAALRVIPGEPCELPHNHIVVRSTTRTALEQSRMFRFDTMSSRARIVP